MRIFQVYSNISISMKIILLQDVPGTGERGDVKEVSHGYARNFLIPKKLAKMATSETISDLEKQEEKKVREMEKELKDNQKSAGKLDGAEIEIRVEANKNGTLYSAIGAKAICQELKKQTKISINPKQLELKKGIKEIGDFEIPVKFLHGLEATVILHVVSQ